MDHFNEEDTNSLPLIMGYKENDYENNEERQQELGELRTLQEARINTVACFLFDIPTLLLDNIRSKAIAQPKTQEKVQARTLQKTGSVGSIGTAILIIVSTVTVGIIIAYMLTR